MVVVPAASAPAEPRVRRTSRKRKEAMGIEEEPQEVKKVKTALPTKRGSNYLWTAEEEAAHV